MTTMTYEWSARLLRRAGLLLGFGAAVLALAPQAEAQGPPRSQIQVFTDAGFRGRATVFTGPQRDLRGSGFEHNISSLKVIGPERWLFCTGPDYSGSCVWFGGTINNMADVAFNDAIGSMRPDRYEGGPRWGGTFNGNWGNRPPPPRRALVVFTDSNFGGRWEPITHDMPDLRATGFNNQISSVVVRRGVWRLCEAPNFQGRCLTVTGDVANVGGFFNDRISSIQLLHW